jgi:tetratricopeptide (TPR) repeat protein
LKNSILKFRKKKYFLLFLLIQVLFIPLTFSQKSDSFIQDSLKAKKLNESGVAAGRLGDYEEAINNFKKVFLLYQKLYGEKSFRLVPLLNNIGIQHKNLGNFDEAIEVYKKAETLLIAAFGDEHPVLGSIYNNIGAIYQLTGDYNKALEYQQYSLLFLKKDSIKFSDQLKALKYNIAETQLKLGQNTEAIRFAEVNLKTTLPRLKPRLFDLIGNGYQNENKFDLSEKYFLLAIKSWVELYGDDNVELVDEYLAYSSLLLMQKQYEKALIYSTKAKSIVLKFFGEKSTAYSKVQSNFGDYYFLKNIEAQKMEDFRTQRKKNLNQAVQYYQNSIVSLVDSFGIKNPLVDPPLKNVISEIQLLDVFRKKASAMEKIGDIFLSEFDFQNAEKYFNAGLSSLSKATQLIHRLRIGFENEESKLFLAQNQESTFLDAIRISYKMYKQTKKEEYVNMLKGARPPTCWLH